MLLFSFLVPELRKAYRCEPKFKTDIWDVFNDKPNWSAPGWADLKRLNTIVMSIVDKFDLLDKSNPKVAPQLEKYMFNLEEIHRCLGLAEAQTLSQASRKKELQADVDLINSKIAALVKKGVRTGPKNFRGSTLLRDADVTTLESWYGAGWKLIYKASVHGFAAQEFHRRCGSPDKTVTVISTQDNLFGGYLDVPWNSQPTYGVQQSSSLFTLKNTVGLAPTQFPVGPQQQTHAANHSCGPYFGRGDLVVTHTAVQSNFPAAFQHRSGTGNVFGTDYGNGYAKEIEVFSCQQ